MEALSKQLHAHVEGNLPKRVTTKTDDFNVAHFGAVDDDDERRRAHIQARRIGSPPTPVTSSEGL